MNHSPALRLTLTVFAAILAAAPAGATSFVRVADGDLADQAAAVVVGRVLSQHPAAGSERPMTDFVIEVETLVAGYLPGSRVVVRQLGGTLADGSQVLFFGAPQLADGSRVLLFLDARGDGTYAILHLLQGAFHLVDLDGRELAFRDFGVAREVKLADAGARHPENPRDLERFAAWLGDRERGVRRSHDYFVEVPAGKAPSLSPGSDEKFTLLGAEGRPARWRQFDSGGVVEWRAHEDQQQGLFGGGYAEFRTAIAAWNADPDTGINLRYRGLTNLATGFGSRDGNNVLLFNDPNRELERAFSCSTGGTIAAALTRFGSPVHQFNGTDFWTMRETDIITNRNTQCFFFTSARAEEVFAHELGHTLGLGHSCGDGSSGPCNTGTKDEALMRAQAHGDNRGASLRLDDRNGIAFLYSQSSPPTGPNNLSASAVGPGLVALVWNDRSSDEISFEIERRLDSAGDGSFEELAAVDRNIESYLDDTASSGLTYTYRVRARNGAGPSGFSNQAVVSTPGEFAPTDLTASSLSTSEVTLTWVDNAVGEFGYQIEGAAGDTFSLLATVAPDSTSAIVGELADSTTFTFRVRAIGGAGDSSYSNEAVATTACVAGDRNLCLSNGRFIARVEWRDFNDVTGPGSVVPFGADDSGLLYFFAPDNWEMLIKVLDGCNFNDRFWVFAAATTNVEYTLTVTDALTSAVRTYTNELGTASPALTDVDAFDTCDATATSDPEAQGVGDDRQLVRSVSDFFATAAARRTAPGAAKQDGCTAGDTALCLNDGRFRVEVAWEDFVGETGAGRVVGFGSNDSGLLYFFAPDNWEMLIKVLDGCNFNDHYWVFSAATTNVEYTLTVTDTQTGAVSRHVNPLGTAAPAITDTLAFATCP